MKVRTVSAEARQEREGGGEKERERERGVPHLLPGPLKVHAAVLLCSVMALLI